MCPRFLRIIAEKVSTIGTPAANKGTNIDITTEVFVVANREAIPSKNPNVKDPESPMKIFAGGKLKNKNPMHAPIIPRDKIAASALFCDIAKTNTVAATIVEIPEARPSNPSIKFIMFAKATR